MEAVSLPDEIDAVLGREWDRLAAPGTWFDGPQRVAIAAAARTGDGGGEPHERAAREIYERPAAIRREWLADLEADGLSLVEYVEVLGIVARLRAVDTLLFGAGHRMRQLPTSRAGEPTRIAVDDAAIDGAWVPTVGTAFPPTILSAVPPENDAMHDLHGALYLAPSGDRDGYSMANLRVVRDGLTRPQLEFLAARTSLLNDCFF